MVGLDGVVAAKVRDEAFQRFHRVDVDARVEVGLHLDDRTPPKGETDQRAAPAHPWRSGQAVDFRELGVSPEARSAWHD